MNKMHFVLPLFLVIILSFSACSNHSDSENVNNNFVIQFPNVLNVTGIPDSVNDWTPMFFSDQGAWHSYSLPDENNKEYFGSFVGPFLNTHGNWLGKSNTKINISNGDKVYNFSNSKKYNIAYYPGKLTQKYSFDDIIVEQSLIFISNRTSLIKVTVKNISNEDLNLKLSWIGETFEKFSELNIDSDKVIVTTPRSGIDFKIFPLLSTNWKSKKTDAGYEINNDAVSTINKGAEYQSYLVHSYCIEENDFINETDLLNGVKADPEKYFTENYDRWEGYLTKLLTKDMFWLEEKSYQEVVVKCVETLINNWKSPLGDLKYDGLFPSASVRYFTGFWAWDSWKHAVALAKFNPELAKNQMRTMFDSQDSVGMIADVIYKNKDWDNWRDTKPPLSAWAVWNIYEADGDKEFLNEMYPKLKVYHSWWYKYRDHDKNGLCEYGSTDGSLVAAKWESGMDDGIRFDKTKMVKNSDGAWSMDQESVDLNSYLYAEKNYLSKIAEVFGENDYKNELEKEAELLKQNIRKLMFDENTSFYYDIELESKNKIFIQGAEGWIPLWASAASPEQAEKVKNTIIDTNKFATHVPFPTISKDDKHYMTGYWRGPVWIDQAYFGIKGLDKYGFFDEANNLTHKLLNNAEGLKNSDLPIRENYDPRNGDGMKVRNFSWSAAHILLLLTEE